MTCTPSLCMVCAPCMVALRLTMCKQLLIVLTHVTHSNAWLFTDAQARERLVVQGEERTESAPPPPCRSHTAAAHPAPPAARRAMPGPPARCGASRRPGGAPQPPPASVPPVYITADTLSTTANSKNTARPLHPCKHSQHHIYRAYVFHVTRRGARRLPGRLSDAYRAQSG